MHGLYDKGLMHGLYDKGLMHGLYDKGLMHGQGINVCDQQVWVM